MLDKDYLPLWCGLNRFIGNYWPTLTKTAANRRISFMCWMGIMSSETTSSREKKRSGRVLRGAPLRHCSNAPPDMQPSNIW
jgi:hypothetical protein